MRTGSDPELAQIDSATAVRAGGGPDKRAPNTQLRSWPWLDRAPTRKWTQRATVGILVGLLAILCVIPLAWLFATAFEDGQSGIKRALNDPGLGTTLLNTLWLAAGSVLVAMVLGTTLAWVVHRLPASRSWLGVIPLAPMVMPAVAQVTAWVLLLSPRSGYLNSAIRQLPFIDDDSGPVDIYSIPGMVALTGLTLTPFVFLFVRGAISYLHQDLIDAALVAGIRPSMTLYRIVLPLIRPALVYSVAVTLILGLGQFTVPLLLGPQAGISVITTEMFTSTAFYPVNYGTAAAFGLPILLAGIVGLVLQRVLIGDQTRYITQEGRGARPLHITGWLGQSFLLGFGVITVVLPVASLVVAALSPYWGSSIDWGGFTLNNFTNVLSDPGLVGSIQNSVVFSVVAVLILLPTGYLCSRIIYARRDRRVLATLTETVVNLPLGIPAVIFGAGFLFAFTRWPLGELPIYGRPSSMVLVYVTLMLPFAVRMILPAMLAMGDAPRDAARAAGAGWLRTAIFIDLPLLRGTLAGTAALMFVLLTHEFSASLLVRSLSTNVMGTALFELWSGGHTTDVAVMALIMCGVTFAGVVAAFLLGLSREPKERGQ